MFLRPSTHWWIKLFEALRKAFNSLIIFFEDCCLKFLHLSAVLYKADQIGLVCRIFAENNVLVFNNDLEKSLNKLLKGVERSHVFGLLLFSFWPCACCWSLLSFFRHLLQNPGGGFPGWMALGVRLFIEGSSAFCWVYSFHTYVSCLDFCDLAQSRWHVDKKKLRETLELSIWKEAWIISQVLWWAVLVCPAGRVVVAIGNSIASMSCMLCFTRFPCAGFRPR